MDSQIIALIQQTSLFRGTDEKDIQKLFKKYGMTIKRFQKGNTIGMRGDPYTQFMILLQGSVSSEMVNFNGSVLEVELIKAPRPLAPAFLFGQNNRLPVDIVANDAITVLYISRESVINLFQENRMMLNHYLDAISNRAQFLSDRLWFMSFKTIREKFAYYILKKTDHGRKTIRIEKSHQELSEYFGVERPSLSRVISQLEKRNIIQFKKRELTVLDVDSLGEILE